MKITHKTQCDKQYSTVQTNNNQKQEISLHIHNTANNNKRI